jgi:hypothetical protein
MARVISESQIRKQRCGSLAFITEKPVAEKTWRTAWAADSAGLLNLYELEIIEALTCGQDIKTNADDKERY